MTKIYGYARVSTKDQILEVQIDEIKRYCKIRDIELMDIFAEKASGKTTERKEFQRMITTLEKNPLNIDAVVITKLDRMGRSLLDLVNITTWLEKKGIGLISITNSIDTTSKEGRLFFYIMSALAEYERELIIERTQAGVEYAATQGRFPGRPELDVDINKINALIASGVSKAKIARDINISRATLYNKLKQV